MPVITIACPHCGLVLRVVSEVGLFRCNYDQGDWQRLCKRLHLGDAAWCQLQRKGTSPPTPADGSKPTRPSRLRRSTRSEATLASSIGADALEVSEAV